jgi:hypothetical protein
MADRKVLVGDIDGLTGIIAHGAFNAGDIVVDPAGDPLGIEVGTAWFYGDGSDGDVTISSNTTLSANMMYNNLTISSGIALNTGSFLVFVKGTLTLGPGAFIRRDGSNASGTAGGSGVSQQVYGGSVNGANTSAIAGTSITNSVGGSGGAGGGANSANGGHGGVSTPPAANNGGLVNRAHLFTLTTGLVINSDVQRFQGGAGGGSGRTGTTPSGSAGGGGGGGGILVVFAREVVVSSGAATISANGGNGANAVTHGGGGGGGGGGLCVVVSAKSQPAGLTVSANGGLGGAAAGATGVAGTAGSAGYAQFFVWHELKETL